MREVNLLLEDCFNPRPRTGGDIRYFIVRIVASFNPRPRTGGDMTIICVLSKSISFNPRPRTGGDLIYTIIAN